MSAALLAAALAGDVAAASPAVCSVRLNIELTPDVPDPPDAGFLSSLLNNQLSYRLTLLGRQPGSIIVTELEGPGPEYRCRNVVEAMRKDGRVQSIWLDQESAMDAVNGGVSRRTLDLGPPDVRSLEVADLQQIGASRDSDDTKAVTIAAAPFVLEENPDAQPSLGGFASLYWAARHPARAWRVFLPIRSDGRETYAPEPVSPASARAIDLRFGMEVTMYIANR